MIYIFVFIISIFFTAVAEKLVKQKSSFYIFSAIAILLPCALAGFRDVGIGTDTLIYGEKYFDWFKYDSYSFIGFLKEYFYGTEFRTAEFSFLLLSFLVNIFTKEIGWFFFLVNFIVVMFFYMAAYVNRNRAPMWLVMFFFFFVFYNNTYNLMRQSIALAMTIYAYRYIEEGNKKKVLLWLFIIFNTHTSGIFYGALYLLDRVDNLKNKRRSRIIKLFATMVVPVFALNFELILRNLTFISDRFNKYLLLYGAENNDKFSSGINIAAMMFYGIIILFYLVSVKMFRIQDKNIAKYVYIKILGVGFSLTSIIAAPISRIALYMHILDCLFVPRVLHSIKTKNGKIGRFLTGSFIVLLFVYWYVTYVHKNIGETYPYRSSILGI